MEEKKQILIDGTINIDFIKNGAVLHEVKKTRKIEEKIDLIKKRLPEHSERRFLIAEIFHFLLYIKDNFSFLRCGLLFPSILI